MKLKHLKNSEVDRNRWRECIAKDQSAPIYCNDWYLDIVSPGWEALVSEDYRSVFPLPVKRKWGLQVVNHPLFAQRFELVSSYGKPLLDDFINSIPARFIGVRLRHSDAGSKYKLKERSNYMLSLDNVDLVRKGYNQNTKRNLKKGIGQLSNVSDEIPELEFMNLIQSELPVNLFDPQWNTIRKLTNFIIRKNLGTIYGVYSEARLVSVVFTAKWIQKIYYLFSVTNPEGKKLGGAFKLIDHIVQEYSGKGMKLDFEGSMIPNIARFFKGFGAVEEKYYEYTRGIFHIL